MNDELRARIRARLATCYGEAAAGAIEAAVEELIDSYAGRIPAGPVGWTQADTMLITYGDSLLPAGRGPAEAPLRTLGRFLRDRLGARISMVHLLPHYPYSSDDGFAVVDYRAVREDLGDWADVEDLATDYRLCFDGVINHVSAESHYLREYLAGNPAYHDFFIDLDPETDTSSVLRTRNLPLLHDYEAADGSTRWLWTTFSRDQVDFNFANPDVLLEILDILLFYASRGAAMIRLDAIPYMWKELGTSCAHLPQTHELIRLIRDVYDAAAPQVLLLTETNVPHHENVAYFGHRGDEAQMIYNFSLAPLILWSIHSGDAGVLSDWARQIEWIGPRATYLNITATHDGIGMRPTEGILSEDERQALVQLAHDHGGDITGKRNADGSVSVYELNITYFDALNDPAGDDPEYLQVQRFMCSQAIPLAFIGIPGIYIHSLLGSRNDTAGVARTGRARSINRQQLPIDRLLADLDAGHTLRHRVFQAYQRLLDLRAALPALHPDARQEILDEGPAFFALRRQPADGAPLVAVFNVTGKSQSIHPPDNGDWLDLVADETVDGPTIRFAPYQFRWLVPVVD